MLFVKIQCYEEYSYGLPDGYETQYGLNPCHNDAAQDADGIT